MFRKATQSFAKRYNSHGHGHVSKLIKQDAFKGKYNKQAGDAFKKDYEEKVHHSVGITALWKKLSLYVAFPIVFLVAIPITKVELDHAKHREHLRHLSDEEWPVQYEYQNIRLKKFFWGDGDKTLFWNSDVNRHVES